LKNKPDYGKIKDEQFKSNEDEDFYDDAVEDWEQLGMDPESSQEEIDEMWDNQM